MQKSERPKNAKTAEKMAKRQLLFKMKQTFKSLEKTIVDSFVIQKYKLPLQAILNEMEKFTVVVKSM